MRNCLILGSGRSGTSMAAGALSRAGYFMGDRPLPSNESSPKGFFEDSEVNKINEELLSQVMPKRPRILGRWFFRWRPGKAQRWLGRVKVGTPIPCPPELVPRIRKFMDREPYCLKDPRFSYTLPAWRPFLNHTVFLCVFRHPAITAESILKDCRTTPYLRSLSITFARALEVWSLMYKHILLSHSSEGEWLFLHYDQILKGNGLSRLAAFVNAEVDDSFPESSLQRTSSDRPVSAETMEIYKKLCGRADYDQT